MEWRSSAFLICLFSLSLWLFLSSMVIAANLTVHNVDTGLSYASIQEAINAPETLDGHTIFVEAGIYYENVVVNKSLTLTGEDRETTIIDGSEIDFRYAVTVYASNTVVSNFTMRSRAYWSHGVYLFHASNSHVHNNNFVDNYYGVVVRYSPGSQVSCNNMDSCVGGVIVIRSSASHVFSNTIHTEGQWGLDVIHSSYISIFSNNITDIHYGVVMSDSCDVLFLANKIAKSYDGVMLSNFSGRISQNNILENHYGLTLYREVDCNIHHNSFMNNNIHAWHAGFNPYNITWDSGYPFGGNYWNNYNGSDLYQGPFQNITGSDGIGDTPYVIDENNTDNYPLIQPYISTHAVAVTCAKTERIAIGVGLTVKIDVGIINYGSHSETFNLTVHLNSTMLDKIEVNLTSINAISLSFTWNTIAFAKGNYTIKATVAPVLGETDISDNNQSYKVVISMVGDITGPTGWPDGEVDMRDIGVAAQAFGSYPGHSRWNLEADITGPQYLEPDNNVDMRDIALIARHFGTTDP